MEIQSRAKVSTIAPRLRWPAAVALVVPGAHSPTAG